MDATGCIYIISGLRRSSSLYVGQSIHPQRRWGIHLNQLRQGTHHNVRLQRSFDKHGEDDFAWLEVERCLAQSLTEREQAWIDTLRSGGCNVVNVGDANSPSRGKKATELSRLKMSLAQKGKTLHPAHAAKIAAAHRGMKRNEESKQKMRLAAKSRCEREKELGVGRFAINPNRPPKPKKCFMVKTEYGWKHSPATRARMSAAGKGKPWTAARHDAVTCDKARYDAWIAKLSLAHRGRIVSAETRALLSAKKKAYWAGKNLSVYTEIGAEQIAAMGIT